MKSITIEALTDKGARIIKREYVSNLKLQNRLALRTLNVSNKIMSDKPLCIRFDFSRFRLNSYLKPQQFISLFTDEFSELGLFLDVDYRVIIEE